MLGQTVQVIMSTQRIPDFEDELDDEEEVEDETRQPLGILVCGANSFRLLEGESHDARTVEWMGPSLTS